jgi:hypothetical protein
MICFRQSRWKLFAATLLFAAWTLALGFIAFVMAHMGGLWPYAGLAATTPLVIAFGVVAFMNAMSFSRPATLTLDDKRLVFTTWRRTETIAREDIAGFIVLSPNSALRSPACEKKTGVRKIVSFGRNWEKSPEEIVSTVADAFHHDSETG